MKNRQPVLFNTLDAAHGKTLGIATLNSESTLNALTIEMVDLLYSQLRVWQDDKNIVAVWLQGAGQKAFCAGGDVRELHRSATENPGGPCEAAENFFAREYRLDYLIHCYKKPVICWGHGIVMGGGFGLMAGCRHRIVTEKTRIAMPEITIGLYPDVGGSWFLNRTPGRVGLYLALTGSLLNAADCLSVGFADDCIDNDQKSLVLDIMCSLPFCGELNADSELILKQLAAISRTATEGFPAGNVEPNFSIIHELTDYATLPDIVEAILNYQTDDQWLIKGAETLAKASPLSACNIFQALAMTRDMSLADIFRFELMLSTNVVRHPEFAEGVRALLIDKDRQPQWAYKAVTLVPEPLLKKMITPPWPENPLADLN